LSRLRKKARRETEEVGWKIQEEEEVEEEEACWRLWEGRGQLALVHGPGKEKNKVPLVLLVVLPQVPAVLQKMVERIEVLLLP